jgi:hypothetical protein
VYAARATNGCTHIYRACHGHQRQAVTPPHEYTQRQGQGQQPIAAAQLVTAGALRVRLEWILGSWHMPVLCFCPGAAHESGTEEGVTAP